MDERMCEPCGYLKDPRPATGSRGMDNAPVCDFHLKRSWQSKVPLTEKIKKDSVNPHDHRPYMKFNQTLSSGRWDASGSWNEAVQLQKEKALQWAIDLSPEELYRAVRTMAADINAFTLYERTAILDVVGIKLRRELDWS